MGDASSWWASKVGAPAPRQAPVYAPQTPAQQPQAPQYQQAPQYAQPAPQRPPLTAENLFAAATTWEGGKGTKTETTPCPQCGGNHYFSRAPEGPSRLPPPAPMCADCGFTGLFYQDPGMPQPRGEGAA